MTGDRRRIPKGLLVEADAANRGGDQVEGQGSHREPQGKGLLVSLAHEVAHQLIVQPALQVEEGR